MGDSREKSGAFLLILDNRFPGKRPIRFFMSQADAVRVIDAILQAKPGLIPQKLVAVQVRLLDSLRGIAKDRNPDNADSFVVHSPNEVYEFVNSLQTGTIH